MAKRTEERENLLRDGRAMPIRGRMVVNRHEVFIGFRSDGQLSLYWDQDPVFQFNADRQLRRVYIDSQRLKAERGQLIRLVARPADANAPVSHLAWDSQRLSDSEQRRILQTLRIRWQQIAETLRSQLTHHEGGRDVIQLGLETVGESPEAFARRVVDWVSELGPEIQIAHGPNA